uniref:EF-hand domain-containing protein n=1 Tax=Acrobeloides nanus TaxID=290746 RepID=A0A914C9Q2_9BILA
MSSTKKRSTTVKKILNAGRGNPPGFPPDTKAIFDYEVLLPLVDVNSEGFPEDRSCYKSIDNTKKPWPDGYGKPLELVFGKKFQLPILETCLTTMLVDEISQFDIDTREVLTYPMVSKKLRDISHAEKEHTEVHHEHHCAAMGPMKTGYEILDDLIQNPRPLRFIVHLIQVLQPTDYEADSWQMNSEKKLESVETLRLEGNELFKKGDFEPASLKYREALTRLDTLLLKEKPGDEEWTALDKKNIPLYLNISQCCLNLNRYYDAIAAASEVLKRDPDNEKALYRSARAKINVWDLDEAEKDLDELSKHPNQEKVVTNLRVEIKNKHEQKAKDDKQTYKMILALGAPPNRDKETQVNVPIRHVPIESVRRPDHLEAVPLERDGSLNKEFRKELLLGQNTSAIHEKKEKDQSSDALIREMFLKADTDTDNRLSKDELKAQILSNTIAHLEEGKKEAMDRFQNVDENGDGRITWDEYRTHFLIEKNIVDKEHAKEHGNDHADNLDTNSRLMLDDEKAAFEQADADQNGLDEIEWLGFQHPEHSSVMLREMAEEIMKAFDDNKDNLLTVEEFAHVEPGEVTDAKLEQQYLDERRHEFKMMIDKNQDGSVTLDELLEYVNPKNERHANEEVSEIMSIADENDDGFVSLDELLDKAELLASSGFIRPKARLHDDL